MNTYLFSQLNNKPSTYVVDNGNSFHIGTLVGETTLKKLEDILANTRCQGKALAPSSDCRLSDCSLVESEWEGNPER